MESSAEGNKQETGLARLDAWLDRATHGLCPQAKERVRREIAAHHAEAVEHLRDTGLSPEAADARAMEGLGDAATANKALRKTYLTTWQQRFLASLAQPVKPINARDYGWLAFQVSFPPMVALLNVCLDYDLNHTHYAVWLACKCVFSLFCLGWIAITGLAFVHALDDSRRHWRDRPLHTRHTAMNRFYPWFLMASLLLLYAAWRFQLPAFLATKHLIYDLFMLMGGSTLAARLNRKVGAYFFGSAWRHPWARIGLILSYMTLLPLTSTACMLWPAGRSVVTTFLLLRPNPTPSLIALTDDDYGLGIFGLVLAIIPLVVCVRWFAGLCLLRKEFRGRGTTEPGPAPCPETPLGE